MRGALPVLLAAVGALCVGRAAWLPTKALVGQVLLERAWHAVKNGGERVRPWPWADTWPVARLEAPEHDVTLIVLRGAQGESLAWGPGHVDGTAQPGRPGNAALGGHRDTSFRFLRDVIRGEHFVVERADGVRVVYEVTDTAIVDQSDTRALAPSSGQMLTLVTCYPFDTPIPGGPLRYVVRAQASSTASVGTPAQDLRATVHDARASHASPAGALGQSPPAKVRTTRSSPNALTT